jgi:hypothetical protein
MDQNMIAGKIRDIAVRLGVDPTWLDGLIAFESNYNPLAQNPTPYNTGNPPRYARGLIQFIDETAHDLGFTDSLELVTENPDFESQMENAVYPYLAKMKPFPNEQSLYMAVFYPAYRNVDPQKPFPEFVTAKNPGIRCPQDYINHVNAKVALKRIIPITAVAGVIALFLVSLIFMK